MEKSIVKLILIVFSVISASGCVNLSPQIPHGEEKAQETASRPRHVQDLAGTWEYEDETGINTITLDEEGKGSYEWEGGWFETHELKEGVWKGRWLQTGNDREGGFELKWLDDSPVAQGRWWYTRIGQDHNPLKPGGTFTMERIPSLLTRGE